MKPNSKNTSFKNLSRFLPPPENETLNKSPKNNQVHKAVNKTPRVPKESLKNPTDG